MKVLVTGATGFIGGRIVDALLSSGGHEIVFTGRSRPKSDDFLKRGAVFLAGDIADKAYTTRVVQGVDTIIHCAGLAGTWGPYQPYYRANVLATRNLLEAAEANGVGRFINISSPSIYFDFKDQLNLRETDLPKKFANNYARTKYESELVVQEFNRGGLETVSLRPRSVVGAGDTNTLPRLVRMQQSGNLKQIGRGENVVDITTIGNLIDAVSLCLKAPKAAMGQTYNISNGAPIRFWSFVDLLMKELNINAKRGKLPYPLIMGLAQLNEWRCRIFKSKEEPTLLPISVGIISLSMTMDIGKARTQLGYRPRLTTEEGVKEFAKWWREST